MSQSKEIQQKDPTQASAEQQKQPLTSQQRTDRWFQVFTAIMLGVVAVATAWSGYQATRWAGEQSTLYAQASALRVISTRDSTLAGQLKLYDFIAVNNWLNAYTQGNTKLANIFEKRFSAELRPAFEDRLATNPFNNPNAPPGPLYMPQYKVSLEATANQLDAQAANTFDRGQAAKEQGDAYVLNTVFLATVLFLTAIAENFKWNRVRAVILAVALVMLLFGIYHLIVYPII
jgi:membrane protease YdiL (CAAX protease family)